MAQRTGSGAENKAVLENVTKVTAADLHSAYKRIGDTTMTNSRYCLAQNILSEIQLPPKGILSHTLYNDEQAKIILFAFAAGEELTAHTAPMPATIQILSGEVTLSLGPDHSEAGPGCLVHMEPHLTHGIVAKTPAMVLLTLLKAARQHTKPQAA
jgi:quercetin dioxygenase-like cupin family protein